MEGLDAFEAEHHAQRPIISAAIAHRVDVRADQQRRRPGRLALVPTDQVADRIQSDRHPGRHHPGLQPLEGVPMGGGQVRAVEELLFLAERRDAENVAARDGSAAHVGDGKVHRL